MKEKLFKQLQDTGVIPKEAVIEDYTEELLLKLATPKKIEEPERTKIPTMEDFEEMMAKKLNDKFEEFKDKHLDKLPQYQLTDAEKALSEPAQKRIKFRKFLSCVMSGVKDEKILAALDGVGLETGTNLYIVPEEFEARIIKQLEDYSTIRRNMRRATMNGKILTTPNLSAGLTAYWDNEGAAGTPSKPTFDKITYTRHKLRVLSGLSQEMLEDSGIDLMSELSLLAANAAMYEESVKGYLGTGSPFYGVMKATGIKTVNMLSNKASELLYEELITVPFQASASSIENAKWHLSLSMLGVICAMKDKNDRPYFELEKILASRILLGFPVELSSVLPASSIITKNTELIFFGNMQHSVLRERKGWTIAMSDVATINGDSAFDKDLVWFKFGESLDIQHELPQNYVVIKTAAAA